MSVAPLTQLAGKRILVTGGNGYIGSHTVIELLAQSCEIVIVDSMVNSHPAATERIKELSGKAFVLENVDVRDYNALEGVFKKYPFDAVIHFAGLKAVGESCAQPVRYFDFNLNGAINLFRLMAAYNVRNLVFSSSATVYGLAKDNPIPETAHLSTTNPYGQTKLMIEDMLRSIAASPVDGAQWKICILRYFNPVGAHPSGRLGEDPNGIPNNLLPFVTQVAVGKREFVNVFGNDYDTPDGTGVRDYIHVVDLARGHLAALAHGIYGTMATNCEAYNLGTGVGYSVLDMIKATEKACGHAVPYKIAPRRPGDVGTCYSDATKANRELHWKTTFTLQDAVNDSWKWQSSHPDGFNTKP